MISSILVYKTGVEFEMSYLYKNIKKDEISLIAFTKMLLVEHKWTLI